MYVQSIFYFFIAPQILAFSNFFVQNNAINQRGNEKVFFFKKNILQGFLSVMCMPRKGIKLLMIEKRGPWLDDILKFATYNKFI